MESLRNLSSGIPDLDLSRIEVASQMPNDAAQIISRLQLHDFEERLARLERMNAAAIAILRRLVDAAQSRHSPTPEKE
jgi:hypothetical protein